MQVLLIDDERAIRRALREILEFEACSVDEAENGAQALGQIKTKTYDLIFSDIKMPQMDGLELLDQILALGIETPVIMISGHGTVETAVGAIKKGAFDFIEKPLDLNRILVLLRQVKDRNLLVQETTQLKQVVKKIKGSAIIGASPEIEAIKSMIEKVAPSDARVLITGGNGTGKELVAKAIHQLSRRARGPLVTVNCAALPATLLEAELFGHEKGAFTGANERRIGRVEQAQGGTLFLDEIGEIDATTEADAVDGGDHRHAQLFERGESGLKPPDQPVKRLGAAARFGGGEAEDVLKGRKVDPAAEMLAPPREDDNAHRDRKSTRLNSSHSGESRMPSSA